LFSFKAKVFMLSICIPVFNSDPRNLVLELHRQAESLGGDTEIILLDDGSRKETLEKNRELQNLARVRYEELPENTGRSRIRNILAGKAGKPFLLFLDCDMQVDDPLFLKNYLDLANEHPVVCGGHVYQPAPPPPDQMLHWKAGRKRESTSAAERNRNPHASFMTANFLIRADVLKRVSFSEKLKGYGHEDTLFGYQLKKNGIPVFHTDNPALHTGLEPAGVFLEKTRQAITNLLTIEKMLQNDPGFSKSVRVLHTRRKLARYGLCGLSGFLFSRCRTRLEKNLLGNKPRLWVFDFYKLGILLTQAI
jgi:glycosyltransferase involved in cell wall biosynthesis